MSQRQRSKQLYTLIFLIGFAYILPAQDWAVIRLGETYNYLPTIGQMTISNSGCGSSTFAYSDGYPPAIPQTFNHGPGSSVKVDSFATNGGDSIFYFNKRITPCITCPFGTPAIIVDSVGEFYYYLDKIEKKANNSYHFKNLDGDSIIINPYSEVNDSIVSDLSSNIIVKVVSCQLDTILYTDSVLVVDSTKTFYIKLGMGIGVFKISKHYGVVYMDLISVNLWTFGEKLIGFEKGSSKIGIKELRFQSIYDFDIGDVFYRQNWQNYSGLSAAQLTYKETILNKQFLNNDTIIYTIHTIGEWRDFVLGNINYIDTIEIKTFASINYPYANMEEKSLVASPYANNGLNSDDHVIGSKDFIFNGTQQYKLIGYNFGIDGFSLSNCNECNYFIYDSTSQLYEAGCFMPRYYMTYGKGLGSVIEQSTFGDANSCNRLIGYIKGGNATGNIIPDNVLLNTVSPLVKEKFQFEVLPNPTGGILYINSPKTVFEPISIQIFTNDGKIVYSNHVKSLDSLEVDLANFPQGVYFLLIEGTSVYYLDKIIRQ